MPRQYVAKAMAARAPALLGERQFRPELAKLTPEVNWASNWPNIYLPHDPWTYAMRFTNYYAQMKAADPTIKVGGAASGTDSAPGTVSPQFGHQYPPR